MSIDKQNFETNCNDCKYLSRSFKARQEHEDFHYNMQKNLFNQKRLKLLKKADLYLKQNKLDKMKYLLKEVKKMRFEFDKSSLSLSYGYCILKNKNKIFSFIPNILMEENINCFKNRNAPHR